MTKSGVVMEVVLVALVVLELTLILGPGLAR